MDLSKYSKRTISFENTSTSESIGPGRYNTPRPQKRWKKSVPFGSTTRRTSFIPDTDPNISPCSYNPLTISSGRFTTLSSNSERKYFDIVDSPSSSKYSHLREWVSSHPTIYSDNLMTISQCKAQFTLENPSAPYPGPGLYSPKVDKGKFIDFSTSQSPQRPLIDDSQKPGPGSYEKPPCTSRKITIPRERAKSSYVKCMDYDVPMLDHSPWKVPPETNRPFGGKSKRLFLSEKNDNPSPTVYAKQTPPIPLDVPQAINGFGIGRPSIVEKTVKPGPADYDINLSNKKSGLTIGKIGHEDIWGLTKEKRAMPGPGYYEIADFPENFVSQKAFK